MTLEEGEAVMRRLVVGAVGSVVLAACTGGVGDAGMNAPASPSPISVPVQFSSSALSDTVGPAGALPSAMRPENHRTHMSGVEEVPAQETTAQGQAIFRISPEGTSIAYQLIVANIEDVLQSHIHMAPAGANGGIVVWLYPDAPPATLIPGRSDGVLATGTITDASLVGELEGEPLSALISAIQAGDTYVNVHTVEVPSGEIRGQID